MFEFRSWKTNYRGEILIHAGQGVDRDAMKMIEIKGKLGLWNYFG